MLSSLSYSAIPYVIISLLLSLGFHEAMHAYVAHKLGDYTASEQGRLTLNPLKHIDLFTTILLPLGMMLLHLPPILIAKPVPLDPSRVRHGEYGAAAVALAGPFTNLVLAAIGAIFMRFILPDNSGALTTFTVFFIWVNIGLFVFNMLPIPPLDGSRLLYAFAPEPVQRVMEQMEAMGFLLLVAILLIFSQFLSPILLNINEAIFTFLLF